MASRARSWRGGEGAGEAVLEGVATGLPEVQGGARLRAAGVPGSPAGCCKLESQGWTHRSGSVGGQSPREETKYVRKDNI